MVHTESWDRVGAGPNLAFTLESAAIAHPRRGRDYSIMDEYTSSPLSVSFHQYLGMKVEAVMENYTQCWTVYS